MSRRRQDPDPPVADFAVDPFAALCADGLPPGPEDPEPADQPAADYLAPLRADAVRLRLEKKGRAGKSVTVLYELTAPADNLEQLGRELRQALGVGGTVRADSIELQGDRRAAAAAWLRARGLRVKGA